MSDLVELIEAWEYLSRQDQRNALEIVQELRRFDLDEILGRRLAPGQSIADDDQIERWKEAARIASRDHGHLWRVGLKEGDL